jgi:hypothetical protein
MKKQQKTMEYIMKKITDKWFEDNPDLVKDIQELSDKVVMFNVKWGTKLEAKDVITEQTRERKAVK